MIKLSYSTMSSLINAPHTWINKAMGLPTRTTTFFEEGKEAHRIVQDSVSGVKPHPLMADFPPFELVEREDFDPQMKIERKFNSKYTVHGYVDLLSHKRRAFGDIKSGQTWSVRKMATHPQFWIYYWALDYPDFTLINLPRNQDEWSHDRFQVYNMRFNQTHKDKAQEWIGKAIEVIENIGDYLKQEDLQKSRHYCFYQDCPMGCDGGYRG